MHYICNMTKISISCMNFQEVTDITDMGIWLSGHEAMPKLSDFTLPDKQIGYSSNRNKNIIIKILLAPTVQ